MTTLASRAATPRPLTVMLIGNPNTGKTTLFNALTGLRHRVGNYPGVTVETKTGVVRGEGEPFNLTDVPGTYSLSPRSPDEMLAVDLLLGHRPELGAPDAVVCILDASNLERNLYLATQALEIGRPTVLALNMIDVAESRGIKIDVAALASRLGAPVIPLQATAGRGIAELLRAIRSVVENPLSPSFPRFPEVFEREVSELRAAFNDGSGPAPEDFLLRRAIIDAGGQTEAWLSRRHGDAIGERLARTRERLREAGAPVPAIEARTRFSWIGQVLKGVVEKPRERRVTVSDRIDKVLIHPVWGLGVFLLLMAVVFQSLFSWASYLMDPISEAFGSLGARVSDAMPGGALRDLLVDGVIAGVGNVVIFVPQIVILFGFIAVLEDCGYMARAAFLMDKVMARCGLSGKSFIPLLSSFACAIPGVMATRTIEDRRDRLATILVAPLMSCSARLPVYVVLIGAFIPPTMFAGFVSLQGLVLLSMYLIGLVLAPLVAWTVKKTLLGGPTPLFLMELPSYKWPAPRTVIDRMLDRGWAFIKRAGTMILATTIVVWALQYYPRPKSVEASFDAERAAIEDLKDNPEAAEVAKRELANRVAAAYQAQSFLGRIGHWVEPVAKPLGWDWRIAMAAIASFPAREVVVSSMGTIFSVGGDADEESVELRAALKRATWPDGRALFSVSVALSLMVFFALCCQCGATLAVIARETNSWRWPIFTFAYMTLLAYVGALATYQIASRLL